MSEQLTVREAPASYVLDKQRVKPGYKQTEVGVIPEDWEVKLLRDVVDFANGKPHEGNVEVDGRYCLITLDSIGIDGKLKAEHKRTNISDSSLSKNDIVSVLSDLAHGNLLGLCDLIPAGETYVLNQRMGRLRLKMPADAQFVRLQINRRQAHFRKRGQGTSQKHIYKRDFDDLPIPIPETTEQQAIAEALSDADALIAALEQLIAKKRHLKQGAMQQLLTGKKRVPGFGGEWGVKTLGELFNFSGGLSASREQLSSEGHCYLHYGDIHGANKTYIDVRAEFADIPKLDVPLGKVSSSSLLDDGDVVFVDASEDDEGTSKHVVVVKPEGVPFISGLHTIVAKS